jgi:hypothetical protein
METKAVSTLLAHAVDVVDQYEYRSGEAVPAQSGATLLAVRFDRDRVDEALARANVGVWGEDRPELVVWLAVMDGGTPRFIGAEDGGALTAALQKAAERRRLPVILPLLDLTDQANLNPADLAAGNSPRIRGAAWRYETDVALVGTLVPAGDFQWESHWRFVGPGQTSDWALGAMGSEEALRGAVDGAYGRLVKLYAPAGRSVSVLDIRVEGIASIGDGDRCRDYLRSLPTVKRVEWASADANLVSWRLTISGTAESFHRILGESRRLRSPADPGRSSGSKVYQWVP